MLGGPHRHRRDPVPDPAVLYYKRKDKNGRTDIAVVRTISEDGKGHWKALFMQPGIVQEFINHQNSPLKEWEPVYALTSADLDKIVEKVAQKVVEKLSEQGATATDIVTAGMNIVAQTTLDDIVDAAVEATEAHTCPKCDKSYKYEKSFEKHVASCSE